MPHRHRQDHREQVRGKEQQVLLQQGRGRLRHRASEEAVG